MPRKGRDSDVTPPRGSGNIELAGVARHIAGELRHLAYRFEKNLFYRNPGRAARLHQLADLGVRIAGVIDAWKHILDDDEKLRALDARPRLVNVIVALKTRYERVRGERPITK